MSYEPDDRPDWHEQFDSQEAAENAWQCEAESRAEEAELRSLWVWTRFYTEDDDWRPIFEVEKGHPGLGPYWCSGYAYDPDRAIICAWVRPGTDIKQYWPEATDVLCDEEPSEIRFTDRFPEPEWWATAPENPQRVEA